MKTSFVITMLRDNEGNTLAPNTFVLPDLTGGNNLMPTTDIQEADSFNSESLAEMSINERKLKGYFRVDKTHCFIPRPKKSIGLSGLGKRSFA